MQSHPTRVRGLKPIVIEGHGDLPCVAPYTGAWIETLNRTMKIMAVPGSHPTRVRGLKQIPSADGYYGHCVAPYTGAWIETSIRTISASCSMGRTLHGCVD